MYKLVQSNEYKSIMRLNDNVFIPFDDANKDYQKYLKWLAEGNQPLPADPISEPTPLTPQQKLEAAGLSIAELKQLLGLP